MSQLTIGPFSGSRNVGKSIPLSFPPTLDGMPLEIKTMIFNYLGPCDEYTSIHDLCLLRSVNRSFAATLAPRVFRTFPFWLEPESLANLNAISEHAQLRHCVQKLIFYPAQIFDRVHDIRFKARLKERIDGNSDTHNDSELRFVKYLGTQAQFIQHQKMLFANETTVKFLVRAFRHLPSVHAIDIFTGRSYIGGAKLRRSFEGFTAQEVDLSGSSTLKIFFKAIGKAPFRVRNLSFITKTMLCENDTCTCCESYGVEEYYRSRCDFSMSSLQVRRDDAVVEALPSAVSQKLSTELMSGLREFKLYLDTNYRGFTCQDRETEDAMDIDFHLGLNHVLRDARNLERFELGMIRLPCDDDGLDIDKAFRDAYDTQPKHLELRHCEPMGVDDVCREFRYRARSLEVVHIEESFEVYGHWREILWQLRTFDFPKLERFTIEESDVGLRYDATAYLKKLVETDPITSYDRIFYGNLQ